MVQHHPHLRIFPGDVFCKRLSTIDRPVLSSGTSEGHGKRSESTPEPGLHVGIHKCLNLREILEYFTVIFEEFPDRGIQTRKALVLLITTGIMYGAAIEDISPAIAAIVLRYALFI